MAGRSAQRDGVPGPGATSRWRITPLCIALFAVVTGCGPAGESKSVHPNLLFIVVDTLRADHLGSYGYARETSPEIDAFARGATRFARAYTAAPWTKPSVASMITGRYPASLGIDNIFSRLPESAETLAEILRAAGYRTAGVVSHVMLSNQWEMGYGQGYDTYVEREARGYRHVSTEGVTDQAIAALEELAVGTDPFLLFVHYFDPHFDYRDHPEVDFAAARSESLDGEEKIVELRERVATLSEADFAFLRDRYDEEIRHTDAGVGRLLAALGQLNLEPNTAVVFVSDHGEQFGEKGWIGHAPILYEMVVRVPLIIRPPGASGAQRVPRVVDRPVSLVSLTPTVLELLGVETSGHDFQAQSFARLVGSGSDTEMAHQNTSDGVGEMEDVFIEIDFPLQDPRISPVALLRRALVGERFKLIVDDEIGTMELYDLETDPHERNDLSKARPALRDRMLAELRERIALSRAQPAAAETVELSEQELEVLRKLGYVEAVSKSAGSSD